MSIVAVPYFLLGLAILIRDDIVQPKDAEKWKVIYIVSKLPWYWWVIATLALMLFVTLEGAYRAVRKRHDEIDSLCARVDETKRIAEAKISDLEGAVAEALNADWDVTVRGSSISDIRVLTEDESRYAIATGVTITNRGAQPLSLSAELLAQWGHPIVFAVIFAIETDIPGWRELQRAYGFDIKNQLLFPRAVAGFDTISGHVVFKIPSEGIGIARLGDNGLSDPYEAQEEPREREYRLCFKDLITGSEKTELISFIHAPAFDGSGISNRTDLAVRGGAPVWVAHDGGAAAVLSGLTTPNVWLEGPVGNIFTIRVRGHASEIRTGPIVTESAIARVRRRDGETIQEWSPRHTLEFPLVGDLCDGEREIAPILLCGEGYSQSTWPEKLPGTRSGLAQFFQNAESLRRIEIGEPDENTTDAEKNDFAERIRRPLSFRFEITFWNEQRQQWKRSELLVYEPTTGAAFVRHSGAVPLLVSGGVAS